MASSAANAPATGHRRNKSAAVLKSIMIPKNSRRAPSDDTTPTSPNKQDIPIMADDKITTKSASPSKGLHKRNKSTVSLRSLVRGKESQPREQSSSRVREDATGSPKKTKSSSNLVSMFGKSRSKEAKEGKSAPPGRDNKENTTPPRSAAAPAPAHTPIWAEFSSSRPLQEFTSTSKVPLNDPQSIGEEIRLYTPTNYSPSKQRNFGDYGLPSLQTRPAAKERPKSTFLPKTNSTTLLESFSRKRSNDRAPLADTKGNGRMKDDAQPSRVTRGIMSRSNSSKSHTGKRGETTELPASSPSPKKPNRVMAAVAAFNGKAKEAKEAQAAPSSPTKLDAKQVEAEFETVLESRNIPQHQRAAMRTLKLEVKADFVRTHKLDTPSMSRATSAQSSIGETAGKKSAKSTWGRSRKSRDGLSEEGQAPEETTATDPPSKRERPRSKTFTFSKADSPVKKHKAERPAYDRKISSKSTPIPKSPSMRSLVSNGSSKSGKGGKTASPDEFVAYMKTSRKVQDVEVGRLQKLRQLLRNETVEWVDTFVQEDGMTELAGLLHRIMEVEWREDHEDQLLHEVLRCLKGLCTTDSALKQLTKLASTLFPALLAMLFDEEHKGPSEFTTRELIIQIIFAHLSTAPESELHARALELLKYLKDPVKEKESSTVPFILQMHQPRPYQVWCKEITNVTKEVFWIFIHHLNVVPLPKPSDEEPKPYSKTHFPGPRAIVPAAPYVGGVEWDATNYIASHLDLLNGIMASLPTRQARNTLRSELQVSGFEKLMGHLRACNPKYYGAVHDAVKVWIAAALEDGWDVKVVRMGASDGKPPTSIKSSPKKKVENAPKIEAPKMDAHFGLGLDMEFEKEIGGPVKKVVDDWI